VTSAKARRLSRNRDQFCSLLPPSVRKPPSSSCRSSISLPQLFSTASTPPSSLRFRISCIAEMQRPAFTASLPLTSTKGRQHVATFGRPAMTTAAPRPPPVETPRRPDGPFALAAIAIFRRVMRPHVGRSSPRKGYDGLVEDCRSLMVRKTPAEQGEIVMGVLSTLFVSPRGPRVFRRQFAGKPGFNARITPLFFRWLVGPADVNDSPEGTERGTGVLIEKCRFLDESGCRGLCLSMCQGPTQAFFTHELGLPLRMQVPTNAGKIV
jgi:hypothetical protein